MAENRIKEIGVRKVLGASVTGITALLAKDFIKLVLAAFVIASPIAWFSMDKWLEGYGYRIEIGWSVFVLSGAMAILIAILTVSYQSIKAAIANPVKSLRAE
jgi:ABC-type antimicrobial peptide transport system permease subunit